jgi:hypothetical protein
VKALAVINSKPVMIAAGVLVASAVIYFAVKKLARAPGEIADDFNAGTPYASERSGAVGTAVRTVANVANQASFGILERAGEGLGNALTWLFNPSFRNYDPNK